MGTFLGSVVLVLGVGWQWRRRKKSTATRHGLLHPWCQGHAATTCRLLAAPQIPSPQHLSEKKVTRANPASAAYCGHCLHSQVQEKVLRCKLLFTAVLSAIVEHTFWPETLKEKIQQSTGKKIPAKTHLHNFPGLGILSFLCYLFQVILLNTENNS